MTTKQRLAVRRFRWYLRGAVAAAVATTAGGATAQPPPAAPPSDAVPADSKPGKNGIGGVAATANTLGVTDCISIALANQSNMKAARASLAASEAGARALDNIHPWTTVLAPDLPVRRMQAARGITVATAELMKVEQETTYDVTRLYYTFVYARQQEVTATDVIDQMEVFYDIADKLLKEGIGDQAFKVNKFTLFMMQDAITEVKRLRLQAQAGQHQALAALKAGMGVDPSFEFTPRDTELPVMAGGAVTREQVVELALARRPELAQAAAGVDAFRLEVCAQYKNRFGRTVPTLASGSDIHARLIPMPSRNGEYRPGAIPPEMPTTLVGRRDDRVARATELSVRQEAVYEKARELVGLEATNAFITYQTTTERLRLAKQRFDNGKEIARLSRENAPNVPDKSQLIRNEALAGRAQSEYLEAVFDHIKAIAALERVTAGGVRFDRSPPPPKPPEKLDVRPAEKPANGGR